MPLGDVPAGRAGVAGSSVLVPAGPFVLGVDAATEPFSLDNERPSHVVDIPAFRIGRVPVTNAEWRAFIDDGGYRRAELWSRTRLGTPPTGGPDRTAVLERPTAPGPGSATSRPCPTTNPSSTSRTSKPRRMRRGRVRDCPPRSSGRRPAPGIRTPTRGAATRGDAAEPTAHSPTSAVTRCDPRRSARTRRARRRTGPSRCSATCGSGPPHRCGRGPASPR